MRNLFGIALVATALATGTVAIGQTSLPPTWGTTGSSVNAPFKKAGPSAQPAPAQPAPAASQPASAQPPVPQPVAQPVVQPVVPTAAPQPAEVVAPVTLPTPAPVPVPVAEPAAAPPAHPQPAPAPPPVPVPQPVQQPVTAAAPLYTPPAPPPSQPVYASPAPQPVAQPVYVPPPAQPVYIPPVQQAAPAQPVYSSTPQNEQIAPQEPVYTPPQEAEQPAYQTPAPAPQPVYIPPMPQPVQQTAPIILPPLDGPYKPDRKKAKAHKNDQQTAGPVQGAGNGPWIDVSAPLAPAVTPVYEGNPPLVVKFTMDMENGDALDLSQIDMGTHTGTHVDAPLHFVRGAPSIDEVPLDRLIGPALVIDVDPRVIAITAAELEKYPWRGHQRVLFRTRNSVNSWIIDPHFHRDFTFLAPDAAQLLADNGVLLVGIDYLSIEQFGAYKPRTHEILLGRGIPIVEGLDLRTVIPGEYDFIVMPLKILGHEAAPARAALRAR